MIDQQALTTCLKDALAPLTEQLDEFQVIDSLTFDEERGDGMVVVGCQGYQQVNAGLPDYMFHYQILVDARIQSDADFRGACRIVHRFLEALTARGYGGLAPVFGSLPVVGAILRPESYSLAETSNRAVFTFDLVTSQ